MAQTRNRSDIPEIAALLAASEALAAELGVDEVTARTAREAVGLLPGRESKVDVWRMDGEGTFAVVRASGRRRASRARAAAPDALAREAIATGVALQRHRARSSRLVAPIVW